MKTAKTFVKLTSCPFARRDSFLAFFNDPGGSEIFGAASLWLSNTRGGSTIGAVTNRQIKLEIQQNGKAIASVNSTTPYEVIQESDHGQVRYCIGGRNFVRCLGTGLQGSSLVMRPSAPRGFLAGASFYDLMDGTWQLGFGESRMRLIPITGKLTQEGMQFRMTPGEDGVIELVFEEYTLDPVPGDIHSFPDYEACLADVKKDFDSYAAAVMPELPAPYEDMRLQALWTTWSHTNDAHEDDLFRHTVVKMMRGVFEHISGWQQAMQAICLSKDLKLAWSILASCFDYQDANGRIADIYDNQTLPKDTMKPPFQGVALLWLMRNRDLSVIPAEEKKKLYNGLKKWTEFFLLCRDLDHDGIWENRKAGETGWEDGPYFYVGFPLASPDMNAYLEICMEALAAFGKELGEPDADSWQKRADELRDKIIKTFWDGERWFAFNATTKQAAKSDSLPLYAALILGDRLPRDIAEKSIEYIFREGTFETPYGLATESLTSPLYRGGWCQGSVVTPVHIIFPLAFEALGRKDLAKRIAKEYCDLLKNTGFYHFHNAISGEPSIGSAMGVEKTLFWSAWTSSCYLFLADRYLRD